MPDKLSFCNIGQYKENAGNWLETVKLKTGLRLAEDEAEMVEDKMRTFTALMMTEMTAWCKSK